MLTTVLRAMMHHNGLGHSGNKCSIMARQVRLNGELIRFTDTACMPGDKITIGKRDEFLVTADMISDLPVDLTTR